MEAVTVNPISSVPFIAASLGVSPASINLAIFSTSTIASSITIPITNAKANRVIVSKLNPAIAITMQVPNKEVGIAKAVIKVALKFLKNGNTMAMAKTIANNNSLIVELVASLI